MRNRLISFSAISAFGCEQRRVLSYNPLFGEHCSCCLQGECAVERVLEAPIGHEVGSFQDLPHYTFTLKTAILVFAEICLILSIRCDTHTHTHTHTHRSLIYSLNSSQENLRTRIYFTFNGSSVI
jgi:hypothetical protein